MKPGVLDLVRRIRGECGHSWCLDARLERVIRSAGGQFGQCPTIQVAGARGRASTLVPLAGATAAKRDVAAREREHPVVDVAMLQTLARRDDPRLTFARYGLVIVDECHHLPTTCRQSAARGALGPSDQGGETSTGRATLDRSQRAPSTPSAPPYGGDEHWPIVGARYGGRRLGERQHPGFTSIDWCRRREAPVVDAGDIPPVVVVDGLIGCTFLAAEGPGMLSGAPGPDQERPRR